MPRPDRLLLERLDAAGDTLAIDYSLDGRRFRKRYVYADVDLSALAERHGHELVERIAFHVAAFEAIPMVSLRPRRLDFGDWSRWLTPALEAVWRRVLAGVGAQWRWQNRLGADPGPALAAPPVEARPAPAEIEPGEVDSLCFNGGGKDSLVAMRLLERAGLPYATLGYAHSTYGGEELQHGLIGGVERHCRPARVHRQTVADELWDDPAATAREYGVVGLICSETPISVFAALPVALAHGYRHLVLANERSADDPNFDWPETGEAVNHQWGKSFEAERLIDRYLRSELLANARYFSLLKPLWDVVIFNLLRAEGEAARSTHSCSVTKPWCERCPKCAYVGAGYLAYLDDAQVDGLFQTHMLDLEVNQDHYRGLLGLGLPKPFECVGELGESRLALDLCRRRGRRGRALGLLDQIAEPLDLAATLGRYLAIDYDRAALPAEVERAVEPHLAAGAAAADAFIRSWY